MSTADATDKGLDVKVAQEPVAGEVGESESQSPPIAPASVAPDDDASGATPDADADESNDVLLPSP